MSAGKGRIATVNELKSIIARHEGRADITLKMAVSTGETLLKMFDEYARVEINEIRQQIELLEKMRRDLNKERSTLRRIENEFNSTYDRLRIMLDLVRDGKIKSISFMEFLAPNTNNIATKHETISQQEPESFELEVLIEGFKIAGELEELRKDVYRWSNSFILEVDDLLSLIDERMTNNKDKT